jgi:hypothetical protein
MLKSKAFSHSLILINAGKCWLYTCTYFHLLYILSILRACFEKKNTTFSIGIFGAITSFPLFTIYFDTDQDTSGFAFNGKSIETPSPC